MAGRISLISLFPGDRSKNQNEYRGKNKIPYGEVRLLHNLGCNTNIFASKNWLKRDEYQCLPLTPQALH